MLLSVIAILVMLVGLVLYLATEAKPSRIGEMMFFAGLLAELMVAGQHVVRVW